MTLAYQPEMFPEVDPHLPKVLPVEDLIPFLRRACVCHDGLHGLSRIIAARLDGNPKNYERQIFRIFSGKQKVITYEVADRLAQSIGLHPMNVWPDLWGGAAA